MNPYRLVSFAVVMAVTAVSSSTLSSARPLPKRQAPATAPVIVSLNPDHASLSQAPGMDPRPTQSTVVIHGKGIRPGAKVIWGETPLTATYVSPTELDVVIDWRLMAPVPHGSSWGPDTASQVPVKVRNPGGKVSRPAAFNVVLTVLGR